MLLLWAVCFLSSCHHRRSFCCWRCCYLRLLTVSSPPTALSRTRQVEARRRAKRDRDLAEQLEQVRIGSGVRPPIFPASPQEAVETQPRDQ